MTVSADNGNEAMLLHLAISALLDIHHGLEGARRRQCAEAHACEHTQRKWASSPADFSTACRAIQQCWHGLSSRAHRTPTVLWALIVTTRRMTSSRTYLTPSICSSTVNGMILQEIVASQRKETAISSLPISWNISPAKLKKRINSTTAFPNGRSLILMVFLSATSIFLPYPPTHTPTMLDRDDHCAITDTHARTYARTRTRTR